MAKNIKYSYRNYRSSGYSVIQKDNFNRYIDMAEKTALKYAKFISEENKRGIYEIADILYAGQNQLNLSLSGFSNENYRESYHKTKSGDLSQNEKIWEIMQIYFTNEQLYRGR